MPVSVVKRQDKVHAADADAEAQAFSLELGEKRRPGRPRTSPNAALQDAAKDATSKTKKSPAKQKRGSACAIMELSNAPPAVDLAFWSGIFDEPSRSHHSDATDDNDKNDVEVDTLFLDLGTSASITEDWAHLIGEAKKLQKKEKKAKEKWKKAVRAVRGEEEKMAEQRRAASERQRARRERRTADAKAADNARQRAQRAAKKKKRELVIPRTAEA